MIRKLRVRLTLLYSVSIGVILLAVIVGIALFNRQELKKQELDRFQNNLFLLTARLQSDIAVSHTWLAQMEAENRMIINILDHQMPLRFNGSWQPDTARPVLISRLQELAAAQHVYPDSKPVSAALVKSSIVRIQGDFGDAYYGTLVQIRTKTSYLTLNLLSRIQSRHLPPWNEGILYLLLYLAGQAAIVMISWYFIGRSMKPVEQAAAKQQQFIAAASHELRSPLAVIQTGLSALTLTGRDKKIVETAQQECRRMSRLVGDMLLLAASDAKSWTLHQEHLAMDTILIECYDAFCPVAREKRQQLRLELPEETLPQITGDRQRIEQVLAILLDNALSYSPPQKTVRLSAQVQKDWLVIRVEDEGPGIADEDKERIFDRFYRVENSRKEKKHFGLGLSIAKELAQLHGGRIEVRDGQGGGAVFALWLQI